MSNPALSIGLALMLLFTLGHNFAAAQEADVTRAVSSVNDCSFLVEIVKGGLISPNTMVFLD